MSTLPGHVFRSQAAAVITRATVLAADQLEVSPLTLAAILGISETTVSRMKRGAFSLEPGSKPFELAILFVRLFRKLEASVGGDYRVAARWLANPNTALDAQPLKKLQTVNGIVEVMDYLDARRALV